MKYYYFFFFSFLACFNIISSQESSSIYYKYSSEGFLLNETENRAEYVRTIYKNIVYPNEVTELDTVIKVLLFNHTGGSVELISSPFVKEFDPIILGAIQKANQKYLRKSEENYFTEFIFQFDYEPFIKNRSESDTIRISKMRGHQ